MKLYESKKKEEGIKLGFNRFSTRKKIVVITLLVFLILSAIGEIVLLLIVPKDFWFLISMILCVIIAIILCIVDSKDQKINIINHTKEHKREINLLYKILLNDYKINSIEKLEILIQKYQKYIDKQNKAEKTRNRAIMTLLSGVLGILSISFSNLDTIGIDLYSWFCIVAFLLIIIGVISFWIYISKYFDSLKHKYEDMINDLEDVKILKY